MSGIGQMTDKTTAPTGFSSRRTYLLQIGNKTKLMWQLICNLLFKRKPNPFFTHKLYYLQANYKYLRPNPLLYTAL